VTIVAGLIRAQDQAGFMELLAPVLDQAHRLAFAMLGSSSEAPDAVQEASLKAWKAFARFRPGSDIRPWFLTITANECRQRRRNRWWQVEKGRDLPSVQSPDVVTDAAVLDLRRSLQRLPIDMKAVLALRYYLDMTFVDMGRVLECSPQAAKSRTHRALARLRTDIPEDLGQ
jgi:RNA polymerase sigma-70 factor (ECF subfamily)